MEIHFIELPIIAGIKGQVKREVVESKFEIPCRVIASVKRMRYGSVSVIYKFDYLIEEGPGQLGYVAHELDHWIEEKEAPDPRELIKDIPTDELAQILAERLKVTS